MKVPPKEEETATATEQSQYIEVWFDPGDMQSLRTHGLSSSTTSITSPTKTAPLPAGCPQGRGVWKSCMGALHVVVPVFLQGNEMLDLWSVSKQAGQKETHCHLLLILGRTSWQRPKCNWSTAARLHQYGLYCSSCFICSSFVHFCILLRMRNQI